MKRVLTSTMLTLTATGLALLGQACNSSNGSTTPPNTAGRVTGPAWTVSMKSVCTDGTDPTQCVAFYGFSADAEGNYKLGPSPANHTTVAKMSDADRNAISDAVKPFLSRSATAAGQACADVDPSDPAAPTSTDTITLTKLGSSAQSIITADPSKLCGTGATQDETHALYAALQTAAIEYYALPFPDACLDAAATVTQLYDSLGLRACNADSDCAYIASDFSVIPADYSQYVATDDCSLVTPLVVANAATVTTKQAALNTALSNAQDACAGRTESGCTAQTGFMSDTGAPTCTQHVCTKNPAAHAMF